MLGTLTGACPLCQNLRNEFLSFRGAWFCEKKDCTEDDMVESSKGTSEGETRIAHGKLQPAAALVFHPGVDVETFTASVEDCKGNKVWLPDTALRKPGSHAIKGQSDSWVVLVDKTALSELTLDKKGNCAVWRVTASATWPKGTSYSDRAGIKAE